MGHQVAKCGWEPLLPLPLFTLCISTISIK